ncbi:MAG: universal stress protein [Lapillicoccus sp.]
MSTALPHPPIVVGVDGSPTSHPALRWAAHEASTRHVPIHLVSAWNPSYDLDTLGLATAAVEEHCSAVLAAAEQEVLAVDPSITLTRTSYIGPATTALIAVSRHADVVVVGSRRLRPLSAFLLGATSLEVTAHAACPVVVVRDDDATHATTGGTTGSATGSDGVVVGVDGTSWSTDAVAYGFAYASSHGLRLTILHAFQVEYVAGLVAELAAEDLSTRAAQEELAVTSEAVAGWQEKYPDVAVETVTIRHHPADALVEASAAASLVVLGGRRRGPLGGALVGAVGHGVLHDAHCPVAVVRSGPHEAAPVSGSWA